MAILRTICPFIENSGIDASWVEADLYGRPTCKQILVANHVKRAIQVDLKLSLLFSQPLTKHAS